MFPKMVYRDGGLCPRKGGTYSFEVVNNDEQLQARLNDGWVESVEEIGSSKKVIAQAKQRLNGKDQEAAA